MVQDKLFSTDPGPSNQGGYLLPKSQFGHFSLRDSLMNLSRILRTYPVVNHSSIVEKESVLKRHDI